MPLPWRLALKVIPWGALVAGAPALVDSARALLAETRARQTGAAPADSWSLADRLAALEARDRETAELAARLAAQTEALTQAVRIAEARLRWLLVLTAGALCLGLAALALALVW